MDAVAIVVVLVTWVLSVWTVVHCGRGLKRCSVVGGWVDSARV